MLINFEKRTEENKETVEISEYEENKITWINDDENNGYLSERTKITYLGVMNTHILDVEKMYNKDLRLFEIKVNNLKSDKRKHYEEWKNNKISQSEFTELYNSIDEKIKDISDEMFSYEISYREKIKEIRKNDYWIGHFKRNRRIKKITKEVLHELVENIFVYENGQVEVVFKYTNEYMNLIKYLEDKGAINNEEVENWNLSKTFI